MDYPDNILCNSRVKLNEVSASSMEKNVIDSTTKIFSNPDVYCSIDKSGSRLMKMACDQWDENVINGFYLFSNHDTSYIPNILTPNLKLSLASQTKCDNMFSYPQLDNNLSHFLGTYLVYILFLLVCGNYPHTLKRERCRNLPSIYSILNRINQSTNTISLPYVERGCITKFEILLEIVFQYSIE